ncbi:MAG: WD40 repeat domain-containing protein [Bryobacteraceae bacterium]
MFRQLTSEAPSAPPFAVHWEAEVGDHVVRMAWSPDGSKLAAAAVGGPVVLFDRSGRLLFELPGHALGTLSLSWRADGRMLATGGQDAAARLWDAESGRLVYELEAGRQWVEQVAFSPTRDYLVTACGRLLKLWSGADGRLLLDYPDHPSTIADVQWQPGDYFFATASYGQLATFRPDSPDPVRSFEWKGSILTIAWSPDGNYVATGNQDASVHFWYRKSGKDLEMTGYPAKVRELAWDSSSRYLATGGSAVVIIWDCGGKGPAGTRPIQLDGHANKPLRALAYQHRGSMLASGGQEGRVCLWRPTKHTGLIRMSELGSSITQLCWAPDDRSLAASSANGLVRVFRFEE